MNVEPAIAGAGQGMRKVLHLSGDFPDAIEPAKTPVIERLVELLDGRFDQRVISLNRRSPQASDWFRATLDGRAVPNLDLRREAAPFGESVSYRAPSLGLFHVRLLQELGNELASSLASNHRVPDLLVAHKLTIEGVAAMTIADRLRIPYAITLQGNTDTKILTARPDLHALFRKIFHGAAAVVSLSPWALSAVEAKLGDRLGPTFVIPAPLDTDQFLPPDPEARGWVSAFHLRNWRTKNLPGLAAAGRLLAQRGTANQIAIVGGGSDDDSQAARRACRAAASISFEGPLDPAALRNRMNRSVGLVMPSLRESFGLVFIEALQSGTPVIYPAGRAIDGYFRDCSFAVPVDPRDVGAIADAMQRVEANIRDIKSDLAAWQQSPEARRFTRERIADHYAAALSAGLMAFPARNGGDDPAVRGSERCPNQWQAEQAGIR